MSLPTHKNPADQDGNLIPNRTACAPYNFVPLPEVVVKAVSNASELPDHDRYYPDRHTGYFEVMLTTKSPLYVRCPFTLDDFVRQERREDERLPFRQQVKNTPHFFYTRALNEPVIPGSSLRGMLRSVVEIVSYSKVQWVTDKQLVYRYCPLDLVPQELRRPENIDYAEALFGFVRTRKELEDMKQHGVIQEIPKQGDKKRAYASRVFVTDATLVEGQSDPWLSQNPIVSSILASPKPTAFQHYLTQQKPNDKNALDHFDSLPPHATTIRGSKRYWHQDLSTESGLSMDEIRAWIEEGRNTLQQLSEHDTQHTQFKPVKPGVQFKFRVYFENLSSCELGTLCWALHPLGDEQKTYCHHLGMGKPLGMGAVKLDATLHLTDRSIRYGSLFDNDNWQAGTAGAGEPLSNRATLERLTRDFEQHILGELKPNKPCTHLSGMQHIAMLLKMMEWPGFRPVPNGNRVLTDHPNTRYMTIQHQQFGNEYRDRPVLPDPSAFDDLTGDAEPNFDNSNLAPPVTSPNTPLSPLGQTSGQPSSGVSSPSATSVSGGSPQVKTKIKKLEPKKVPVTATEKEWVTLVEDTKAGKAKVRTEQGEIIPCSFPQLIAAKAGQRCRADVTREDRKAQRATFKGLK